MFYAFDGVIFLIILGSAKVALSYRWCIAVGAFLKVHGMIYLQWEKRSGDKGES